MDIRGWLRGLGLEQYEQAFADNAIDGEVRFQGFGRRVELWPAVDLDPDDAADHRATIGLLQSTFDLADHIEG